MNHEDKVRIEIRYAEEVDDKLLRMCYKYDINGKTLDWSNEFVESVCSQYLESGCISYKQRRCMRDSRNTIENRGKVFPKKEGSYLSFKVDDDEKGYEQSHVQRITINYKRFEKIMVGMNVCLFQ